MPLKKNPNTTTTNNTTIPVYKKPGYCLFINDLHFGKIMTCVFG